MAEKVINGQSYRSLKMAGEQGFYNTIRLGKLIGPSLEELAALRSLVASTAEVDKAKLEEEGMKAVLGALANCDPAEITVFMRDLMAYAEVEEPNGSWINVGKGGVLADLDFAEIAQVLWLVMRENFANFFAGKGLQFDQNGGREPPAGSLKRKFTA